MKLVKDYNGSLSKKLRPGTITGIHVVTCIQIVRVYRKMYPDDTREINLISYIVILTFVVWINISLSEMYVPPTYNVS